MDKLPFLCVAALFAGALSVSAQVAVPGQASPPPPFGAPPSLDNPVGFSEKLKALRQEELAKRELKTMAAAYAGSLDPAEREAIAKKLQAKLEEMLRQELEKDKEAVASLEKQLEQARKRLAKRIGNQEKMLELKLNALLADSDLSW